MYVCIYGCIWLIFKDKWPWNRDESFRCSSKWKKLEAYYYPQHLHNTTKPNKNHTTHTIITPKAQPSSPKFHAKPQLLIYNNKLSIHKNSKQLTVVNLQSQTTKLDNPNTQLYISTLVNIPSSQQRNKQRITRTCFPVEYLYKQP